MEYKLESGAPDTCHQEEKSQNIIIVINPRLRKLARVFVLKYNRSKSIIKLTKSRKKKPKKRGALRILGFREKPRFLILINNILIHSIIKKGWKRWVQNLTTREITRRKLSKFSKSTHSHIIVLIYTSINIYKMDL